MSRHFLLCLSLVFVAAPTLAQTPAREFARAQSAWHKENYAAAENYFSQALNLSADASSDEAHAYFGRGLARLQQEKWRAARDDLSASIELAPDNPEAFASRGMARKALGDTTGLLEDAPRAAQLDSEYRGFEDDAKSTVLWRRSKLLFLVLGGLVVCVGLVPLVRGIVCATQGERDAKRRDAARHN